MGTTLNRFPILVGELVISLFFCCPKASMFVGLLWPWLILRCYFCIASLCSYCASVFVFLALPLNESFAS